MPSLHYVRKDGVTYDINGDVLAQKANIDGYYQDLGAGIANQLKSDITVEDKVPYLFRTSGGSVDIGDRETDMVVGGSLAWNQLANITGGSKTQNGITASIDAESGLITLSGTSGGTFSWAFDNLQAIIGHKYVRTYRIVSNPNNVTIVPWAFNIGWNWQSDMCNATATLSTFFGFTGFEAQTDVTGISLYVGVTDLTLALGTAIADYAYALETGTAGAGVAWLKAHFPKMFGQYQPYNAGSLESVSGVSAHEMTGFNQWDEEWEVGYYNDNGTPVANANRIRSKNSIKVVPNSQYYVNAGGTNNYELYVLQYDASGTFLHKSLSRNTTFTTTAKTYSILFFVAGISSYNNDICINLSWDGSRNGEYEPYVKHSYALDSSLTLRGIPKLDANNSLYYDGDTYESDGTVQRRYGVVDLGTLSWERLTDRTNPVFRPSSVISDMKAYPSGTTTPNMVCQRYQCMVASFYNDFGDADNNKKLSYIVGGGQAGKVVVQDSAYTDAATFKAAMSGVYLVYELATPTTESATPYTNPQIVDDFGTEEYVTTSIVPVGHITGYQANLKAKVEMAPDSPDGDGDYIVRQSGGTNEYVSLASNSTIQDIITRLEALENA